MKKLELSQMESLQGGTFQRGFCRAVGGAGLIALVGGFLTGGAALVVAAGATAYCLYHT